MAGSSVDSRALMACTGVLFEFLGGSFESNYFQMIHLKRHLNAS